MKVHFYLFFKVGTLFFISFNFFYTFICMYIFFYIGQDAGRQDSARDEGEFCLVFFRLKGLYFTCIIEKIKGNAHCCY